MPTKPDDKRKSANGADEAKGKDLLPELMARSNKPVPAPNPAPARVKKISKPSQTRSSGSFREKFLCGMLLLQLALVSSLAWWSLVSGSSLRPEPMLALNGFEDAVRGRSPVSNENISNASQDPGAPKLEELRERAIGHAAKGEFAAAADVSKECLRFSLTMTHAELRLVYKQIAYYLARAGRQTEAEAFASMAGPSSDPSSIAVPGTPR
ncbi:MAG: hypothetical protein QF412_16215 [Planctomycetota bacterium]|jgi:hypothetical protein|nr:hypothetical protein [Planctomycetota bacterium]